MSSTISSNSRVLHFEAFKQRKAQKVIIMKNLSMLSNNATIEQQAINSVKVSSKLTAKKAEKTCLNHSIVRNNALTDTARLDYLIITALVLTDFAVTTQQIVALAESVDLSSTRVSKHSEIAKHCKDDKICTVSSSMLTVEDERLQEFFTNAFYSQAHMMQLQKHAVELFAVVVAHVADNALESNAHEQALMMHSELIVAEKKAAKKAAAAARKAAKSA